MCQSSANAKTGFFQTPYCFWCPCYFKPQIKLKNSDNYGQGEEVESLDPILLICELLLCKLERLEFCSGFQKYCVKKGSWSAVWHVTHDGYNNASL